MIDANAARMKVEQLIASKDMKGHTYRFASVNSDALNPREWAVVFDWHSPEDTYMDGPAVFLVDKVSGDVRIL